MKLIMIILISSILFLGCTDKRVSPIETTKLFIKYTTDKDIVKLYSVLSPENVKKLKKDKKYLLRLNSQINRYDIKDMKVIENKDDIAKVEILLTDGTKGIVNLKKINNRYYVELGL